MREILGDLLELFTNDMNAPLVKPITNKELLAATMSMVKGKAPRHDGIPIEFFQLYWNTIGEDYHKMVIQSMENGAFHEGITKELISLIPKEGDTKDLHYWRPITLFMASYKIFAKTLQLRLQPILRDAISPEQTAFLPLIFILDNIVLTQELLQWAKVSKQPTVFLKLDFSKAYDKVSWVFLFSAMRKLNISPIFIKWVKLLFINATAAVNLNGSARESFKIEYRVRQGCPLAPYIFLIVGKTLTQVIKKAITKGRLRGIILPGGKKQQSISQYVDDSSFMVRGEKMYVDELVRILKVFSAASGMEINWEKSSAYWFDKHTHKPEWLNGYNWQWANEGDLSKLLGTPFGLNLHVQDVDDFLYRKIARKLDYWSKMKLSLAGRAVICNQVLLSTL